MTQPVTCDINILLFKCINCVNWTLEVFLAYKAIWLSWRKLDRMWNLRELGWNWLKLATFTETCIKCDQKMFGKQSSVG